MCNMLMKFRKNSNTIWKKTINKKQKIKKIKQTCYGIVNNKKIMITIQVEKFLKNCIQKIKKIKCLRKSFAINLKISSN